MARWVGEASRLRATTTLSPELKNGSKGFGKRPHAGISSLETGLIVGGRWLGWTMTAMTTPRHRVATATARMRAVADGVVEASVWSMDPVETGHTLVELTRLEAQVGELKARVAAHADDLGVGEEVGATSAANWLAHRTRQTRREAHRTVRLGHDLDTHPLTRDALATGAVLVEQAQVVVAAVDALPDDLDTGLVTQAEAFLVEQAAHLDARALRIAGRRLVDVIAPDVADAHEAKALEKEEAEAAQACRLTMSDDGHGKTHGRFTLPTAQAQC